jgi:3-hydroxyacyl-[acyl-carrier-protein] dehydratase
MAENVIMDTLQLREVLPHRYPFLLIDKVVELVDNEKCVCIKCVTINEEFFQGHFPQRPVMPGVLVMEAMAQTAAVFARKSSDGADENKTMMIVGVDDFKWKKMVVPGDVLRIEVRSAKKRRPLWVLTGEVTVDGKVVAKGTLSAMEVD